LLHAEQLLEAAPDPQELHVIAGLGHADLVAPAGGESAAVMAARRGR
jgi:hypothetical protein